ncbi:hypothetical protein RE6C_00595 [Rhodopirellula europaea 6C]|uniref:Uncharacterized protein n=1 Tax=Rhodopirellula europaea 6C TaxID=1263867 RepID=M2B934_9BACT|nr:hypothetical protein RE6C_00595 [Rhodopirellula europaea 6C]
MSTTCPIAPYPSERWIQPNGASTRTLHPLKLSGCESKNRRRS